MGQFRGHRRAPQSASARCRALGRPRVWAGPAHAEHRQRERMKFVADVARARRRVGKDAAQDFWAAPVRPDKNRPVLPAAGSDRDSSRCTRAHRSVRVSLDELNRGRWCRSPLRWCRSPAAVRALLLPIMRCGAGLRGTRLSEQAREQDQKPRTSHRVTSRRRIGRRRSRG